LVLFFKKEHFFLPVSPQCWRHAPCPELRSRIASRSLRHRAPKVRAAMLIIMPTYSLALAALGMVLGVLPGDENTGMA
jgi:hypothetical protein